jgi:hypothetical protein
MGAAASARSSTATSFCDVMMLAAAGGADGEQQGAPTFHGEPAQIHTSSYHKLQAQSMCSVSMAYGCCAICSSENRPNTFGIRMLVVVRGAERALTPCACFQRSLEQQPGICLLFECWWLHQDQAVHKHDTV